MFFFVTTSTQYPKISRILTSVVTNSQINKDVCVIFIILFFQDELQQYGIDWNGPPAVDDDNTVEVPAISCPLQNQELDLLRSFINPLDECDDLGVSIYAATRSFVEDCIYAVDN